MADRPDAQVVIRDFPGLIAHSDILDLPKGAASEQVNAASDDPGILNIRPGLRKVTFENN